MTPAEYVHLLRQYTGQHRLISGELDLQENYNPDTGSPIVGLPRSHHSNHSTYVDLVLSGLLGIRPEGREPSRFETTTPIAHASSTVSTILSSSLWMAGSGLPRDSARLSLHPKDDVEMSRENWYSVDLRRVRNIVSVDLAFFALQGQADVPEKIRLQVRAGADWKDVVTRVRC